MPVSSANEAKEDRSMRKVICVVAALLVLAGPDALAATRDDPDDVGGKLDLRQVTRTYSNTPSRQPMVHLQVTTYDGWTLRRCFRAEGCTIVWYFDSKQGGGIDRAAYWVVGRDRNTGRFEPHCWVFNYRTSDRVAVGNASKFRHSAFCSFEKAVLDAERLVRWRVVTSYEVHTDRAPDIGWYG
jgi:hypothetical protein